MSVLSLIYFLHSFYVTYPNLLNGYQKRIITAVNLTTNSSTLNGGFYRLYFDETINFYKKEGIFNYETPIFDTKNIEVADEKLDFSIEKAKNGHILTVRNVASEFVSKEKGYYISLENAQHQYYFLPLFHHRNSIKSLIKGQPLLRNEVIGLIADADIPADSYQVGLVSTISSKPKLFKSDKFIRTQKVGYNQ
jgi:hypothetical protein